MVTGARQTRPARSVHRCSCDLMTVLSMREPVAQLLAKFGLSPGQLHQGREALHHLAPGEPADWRVRLDARGAGDGDLPLLLAICRSADSHAYQLLEHLGVPCTRLRKLVIERVREQGTQGLRSVAAGRSDGSAVRSPRPTRSSRPRRAVKKLEPRRPSPGPSRASAARPAPERELDADAPRINARRGPREVGIEPEPVRPEAPATVSESDTSPAAAARAPAIVSEPCAARLDHRAEPAHDLRPVEPGALPRLHGRQRDLERLADAMGRRVARPTILVAPPGSGRTSLARHLATRIAAPLYWLTATDYDDESGLNTDLETVARAGGVAVLDDLDRVATEAPAGLMAALCRAWTSGQPPVLTVVGAEGHGRLAQWTSTDDLDVLRIDPLRGPELVDAVVDGSARILEQHGVVLGRDAKIGELVRLADRYLTGLAMPGRALDLLDLACARTTRCGESTLSRATWLDIVSERSGLSHDRIELRGDHDVLELEQRMARRVVGHESAIGALCRLVRRNRAGFGGSRPVLTTLLLGPSGVGKTEIAKALCAALFDRDDALVRLDMSEYAEPHAVARIVGAPPGYVGHEHGGALTDPLRARPHCTVLLDEIEKAHRDVHQLLLQIFDEGRLTDGRGRIVDFRHAVIVMTSNLGADLTEPEDVLAAARAAFPVELYNRIEAPLVMQPLTRPEMARVCRRLARASSDRLFRERGIRYGLTDAACDHLVHLAGRDPALGARPLRHLLTRDVESTIADAILSGRLRAGTQVEADVAHGRVVLR